MPCWQNILYYKTRLLAPLTDISIFVEAVFINLNFFVRDLAKKLAKINGEWILRRVKQNMSGPKTFPRKIFDIEFNDFAEPKRLPMEDTYLRLLGRHYNVCENKVIILKD